MKFGVAGYPPAFNESLYRKDRKKIFNWLSDLGLDALELQMTYGPRTSKENCLELRKLSEDFQITLSVHASYFIVFTSNDRQKLQQSVDTLNRTYELADILGTNTIVLHPGPLYTVPAAEIMTRLIDNLHSFFGQLGNTDIGLFLETAGKRGQLGSVEEVIEVSEAIKGCFPCIDFGHVHARTGGTLGSPESIDKFFVSVEQIGLFKKFSRIHFHYTPIHYGAKGEISHKAIDDIIEKPIQGDLGFEEFSQPERYHPRFEQIALNLLKYSLDCTVISETHNSQERGALALKNEYYRQKETYKSSV